MRYALVVDDRVVNLIVWDGVGEIPPEEGVPIQIADDSEVAIGWTWSEAAGFAAGTE